MSAHAGSFTPAASVPARPWYRSRKLDQWICFWSVPFFYNLFGLVFVPLSSMMPPKSPSASTEQIVGFFQGDHLLIACVILTLSLGLAPVSNAVYLTQIRRMSVSPAFRVAFLGGTVMGAIVGMTFPLFCFGLGAFRPGYDADVLVMLYDFGYLAFIGSLGCFCVTWSMFGLAIILDQNRILPKWLGYYTVWQFMSELMAAPIWLTQSQPFGWNGVMTFWFAMLVYVPWQFIIYVWIYKAIKRQPESELDNAPSRTRVRQRDTAGARP